MKKVLKNQLATPIAIVFAGAIIASAVLYSGTLKGENQLAAAPLAAQPGTQPDQAAAVAAQAAALDNLAPITEQDYVRGSRDAKVVIVEYSDYECPFCKRFHATMNQIMDEYGEGEVAWVLRQFPLDSLHPVKARQEALASECAGKLGGNEGFWNFADRMFELTGTNNRTDVDTVLPQIAAELGFSVNDFTACMESDEIAARVNASVENASATGGNGTPWSILVAADGTKFPINGAQQFETVKQTIDKALAL